MKKRLYAGIMVIAVSMAVTACGGGTDSSKSEKAEIAAELEKELSADDKAAIKEAQAELRGETEKDTESETDSNDPWTNGLLEKFGCADMPRPNENYPIKEVQFKELKTHDKANGNKIDNGYELYILFDSKPYIYEDYIKQFEDYLKTKDIYKKHVIRGQNEGILIHGNIAGINNSSLPVNSYDNVYFKYDGYWVHVNYWMGETVKGNSKLDQGIHITTKYDGDFNNDFNQRKVVEVNEKGEFIE